MKINIKEISNSLKSFKDILANTKNIFYVVIAIMMIINIKQCTTSKDERADRLKAEQNLYAANDTIKYYKNKSGILQAEKGVLILSEKELKKENNEFYKKIKNQKGNIISLNSTILTLKQDKYLLQNSINFLKSYIGQAVKLDSNLWELPWELRYDWDDSNYDIFNGKTLVNADIVNNKIKLRHNNTLLLNRETQIDIEFGEKVVDGKYNVFINSKYPGFKPESLEGVFIDPNTNKDIKKLMKKDHWFTGFSLGLSVSMGYDIIYQHPTVVVGPSLTYSIYQW
jgi:hypothetical protein